MMKSLLALAGLLLIHAHSAAEVLTLQECITLALRNNLQHQNDYHTLANSHSQLEAARAPFAFNMDANITAPSFSELRDTQENIALSTRVREENTDFRYRGDLRMSQRMPHLGELSLTTTALRRDFSSNRRTDFLDFSGDMLLEYEHQILNRPSEEIALKRSEHGLHNARLSFERQRLQLEGQVVDDYYTLVQNIRELEIERQRMAQSRANLELAQRKFEVGLIAEVESLRLQVEMLQAEASFAQAETAIERRRDILRETLGLDASAPLDVATEVDYQIQPIDANRALELGLARRTDMQRAEITEEIRKLELEDARRRNGINANLNANLSLQGRGSEIGDISRNLERNRWGISIQMNLPLIDGGQRRASLNQARIALEQSRISREQQRRQIVRQIRDATRSLSEAERQIELRQAALEVAARTYDVEQSRFELGLADSQQLLQAQGDMTRARIDALAAIITYQRELKNVRVATMAELEELTP
jgi:outer membrane protein